MILRRYDHSLKYVCNDADQEFNQYDELLEENGTPMQLVESIEANAKHYLDIFAKAVDAVMPDPTREIK